MKLQKLIAITFVLFTLISCKDDKKTEVESVEAQTAAAEPNNKFTVTFTLIAVKDDNFHMYYTEDGSTNFTEEQSLWHAFKGSDTEQEVAFYMEEDAIPTFLRFDFGHGINKDQKEIVLKKFKMEYNGKTFETKGSDIFTYFYANTEGTVLDHASGTLKRISADQQFPPSLYPQEKLREEIMKLVK